MKTFMKKAVFLLAITFFAVTVFGQDGMRSVRQRLDQFGQRTVNRAQRNQQPMIKMEPFGKTEAGEQVNVYTLTNKNGVTAKILNFGGVLYSLEIPDRDGKMANVSANYETVGEYEKHRPFFGSLIGRYGNRIAAGKFTLDGKEYTLPTNNGKNALHGGLKGFDQKIWKAETLRRPGAAALQLSYLSKDGEEGYPGNLNTTVVYELNNDNELKIEYFATTDRPTVLNLTNHTFWNLAGAQSGTILDHELTINADKFLPTDDGLIPTGELANVEGTPLDFRAPKKVGKDIDGITEAQFAGGYDHCLVLNQEKAGKIGFCAKLVDPKSGRAMTITTDQPAVQFYSGNFLDGTTEAFGHKYDKHSLMCLETQHYPDAPNQEKFPSTVLKPGEKFHSVTVHKFSVE